MKFPFTSSLGLAAFAALCLAHTANAVPVGSFSCTSANGNDIKFNVSYFTFGVSNTAGASGSSGAGAGKATFQALEVHAALSTFDTLLIPTSSGAHFENCILTSTFGDGATVEYEFKTVAVKALTAVGERTGTTETPAQYTDVQFEYLAIAVKTSGGSDDGGTTPASLTNRNSINGAGN